MTRRQALRATEATLADAGCSTPAVDAELLLRHALGVSRSALFAEPERSLTREESERLSELVRRRARREPLAHVLGSWGFRGLELVVGPHVLVPRPETEIVVERCLARLEAVADPRVLDVGTGSGAIALAIASERPDARVVATDISADALAVAAENRRRLGLDGRVELVLGFLVAGARGPFDLVVSNPPYVPRDEYETLEPEVRLYEPFEALVDGGQTDAIARRAREVLLRGGWLVLEIHERRARQVSSLLRDLSYEGVAVTKDLAGRDRVVEGRLP